MPLEPWQAQIDSTDLLVGVETSYQFTRRAVGGLGLPGLKGSDVDLAHADGVWFGPDYYGKRVLGLAVRIKEATQEDAMALFQELKDGWRRLQTETRLDLCIPGFPGDDSTLSYFGRPRGIDEDFSDQVVGIIQATLIFECADPYGYGPEVVLDFDPGDELTVTNDGIVASRRWTFEIPTGTTNPKLYNDVVVGEYINLGGYSVTGNPVILDGRPHTILQNGVSKYSEKNPDGAWPNIRRGANTFGYSNDSGSGVGRLTWRSAWL